MAQKIKKLSIKELEKHTKAVSSWKMNTKKTTLTKQLTVPSFVTGLAFAAKIAVYAEVLNHYPEITLSKNKIKISLTTPEIKGLSKIDFEFAKKIDNLRTN